MPNGTRRRVRGKGIRRAHTRTRNGRVEHVGQARIAKGRQRGPGSRPKQAPKPLLYAACTTAGVGALTALLTGRWGAAFVLFGLAGAFGAAHLVRQHHKKRQAMRPATQRAALPHRIDGKAQTSAPGLTVEPEVAAANARDAERNEVLAKQRRYDEMQAMLKRQRARGQTEMVWPSQYEEFFDGPGKLKPRPGPASRPEHPSVARAKEIRAMHNQGSLR